MKNRLVYIIAVALIIAVAFVVYFSRFSTIKKELRDFAVPDTALVDKIFMVDKMNQTVLLERNNNEWRVNGKYCARRDAIFVLLKTIARLDIKSPVSKSMLATVISQMASRSVKVEVYKSGKLNKTFYVGGPTADEQGTFMMLENSSTPFIMQIPGFFGYLSSRFFIEEYLWRDQTIFRRSFKEINSVKVDYPADNDRSYMVINKGPNTFSVESKGKELPGTDTLKTKEYLGRFTNVCFESIIFNLSPARADSLNRSLPYAIITLKDKKGNVSKLSLWKMLNHDKMLLYDGTVPEFNLDAVYGRIEGDDSFLTVQYFVTDPLLKDPSYFIYSVYNK